MARNNSIIPEVIEDSQMIERRFNPSKLIDKLNSTPQDQLNIHLTRNEDKRIINTTHNTNTHNETNNTYNQVRGGFFRMIFDLVCFPFKISYRLALYLEKTFNIKNVLKEEREDLKKRKWIRNYMKSTEKNYDFEEIY